MRHIRQIEAVNEQRKQLPLPAAALIIDVRGMDDDDVIEWLEIEMNDLATEMKINHINHWRYITDFISFRRIKPFHADPDTSRANGSSQNGATTKPPKSSLLGGEYTESDTVSSDEDTDQLIAALHHEIDRLRTNRIAAVNDLDEIASRGRSRRDGTVRIIFLADAKRTESLSTAAHYAKLLKDHYQIIARQGYQPLVSTAVLCINHGGEAGPPQLLIEHLSSNHSWDHLDSLILTEDYREDAARITGSVQSYLAELLLYVLLIVPPFSMGLSDDPSEEMQAMTKQPSPSLPYHTYVVGLAAVEYSARWATRWLSSNLTYTILDQLRQKPQDMTIERGHSEKNADSWLQEWLKKVHAVVPDKVVTDNIQTLEGINRSRQAMQQPVFNVHNIDINLGKSTMRDLEGHIQRLAETYIAPDEEPTLQRALLQGAEQIIQNQHEREQEPLSRREVNDLGKLQTEAIHVLAGESFFNGVPRAVHRARLQLEALGNSVAHFRRKHQDHPLNPTYSRDRIWQRREDLKNYGQKKLNDLKRHLASWPFFCQLLLFKQTFAWLTMIMIMALTMITVFLGAGWLHHLLVVESITLLQSLNDTVAGIPMLVLYACSVVVISWIITFLLYNPRRMAIKRRSALQAEGTFLATLGVFALFGFFIPFSLDHLEPRNDPVSVQYVSWLSWLPSWCVTVGIIALLIVTVEVIYYLWWVLHLFQERKRIVKELHRKHESTIADVCSFIAEEVALDTLIRAELIDPHGDPGSYLERIVRLCNVLDHMAEEAKHQQSLASHRLRLSRQESLSWTNEAAPKDPWLNLQIRDERLPIDELTTACKNLIQQLETDKFLRELAICILLTQGAENPLEISYRLAEEQTPLNNDERQLHLFVAMLAAIAMRASANPQEMSDIDLITAQSQNMDDYMRRQLPTLQILIDKLKDNVSQAMLIEQAMEGASQAQQNSLLQDLSNQAIVAWSQFFWQHRKPQLHQRLSQGNILKQLSLQGNNSNDPRVILRHLRTKAAFSGRSSKISSESNLFLLLPPSPESYQFRQILKKERHPVMVDFPDAERILLLGILRYVVASPLPLPAPGKDSNHHKADDQNSHV